MFQNIRKFTLKYSQGIIMILNVIAIWNIISFYQQGNIIGIVVDSFLLLYVNIGLKMRSNMNKTILQGSD